MPRGFFTQGAIVLTSAPLAAYAVEAALAPFTVAKRSAPQPEQSWMGGHATWVVVMRPEVNGLVTVEVVDQPWPDDMGDPKHADKSRQLLFGAWSMGFMGPFTWPGCFDRARQYARVFGRADTAAAAERHAAFVRIRSSYVLGAGDDAKILPADYDPRAELEFVTAVARAVAHADGAICYFNPGGETLLDPRQLDEMLEACRASGIPPLAACVGVRIIRLDDAPPWVVADTIGMEQLAAQDHEACFERGRHDANEVALMLRNMTIYAMDKPPGTIRTGHTTDGPGGVWRAAEVEETFLTPPRPVIRWLPADARAPLPPQLDPAAAAATAAAPAQTGSRSRVPPPMPPPSAGRPPGGRPSLGERLKTLFGR